MATSKALVQAPELAVLGAKLSGKRTLLQEFVQANPGLAFRQHEWNEAPGTLSTMVLDAQDRCLAACMHPLWDPDRCEQFLLSRARGLLYLLDPPADDWHEVGAYSPEALQERLVSMNNAVRRFRARKSEGEIALVFNKTDLAAENPFRNELPDLPCFEVSLLQKRNLAGLDAWLQSCGFPRVLSRFRGDR